MRNFIFLAALVVAVYAIPRPDHDEDDDKSSEVDSGDICSLPPVTPGPVECDASFEKWTYNKTAGACVRYVYGGCGGTANLFSTELDCLEECYTKSSLEGDNTPAPPKVCELPMDWDQCQSHTPGFAFIKEKNRCERFANTGCFGDANYFKTAEECYKSCGGDAPSTSTQCERIKCDLSLSQYYENRGCRPQYEPGACCPMQYVCPEGEPAIAPSCSYRGVRYAVGERIPQISEDKPCKAGCFCHGDGNSTKIVCANVECFHPNQFKRDCTRVYDHSSCCPTKYICPGDETLEESVKDGCYHKDTNTTYYKGEHMPSDDPCKSCICLEGRYGVAKVVCKKVHCIIELPAPDCIPVYEKKYCCPVDYMCPKSANQVIEPEQEPGTVPVVTLPALVEESSATEKNSPVIDPVQLPEAVRVAPLPAALDQTLPSGAVDISALIPGGGIESKDIEQRCLLPKEVGPCRGFKPMFYHDVDQRKCLRFSYGGCKGNENRFDTEKECNRVCNVPVRPRNEVCSQRKKFGYCARRYYFDTKSETCVKFHWGGCFNNGNSFKTIEECLATCAPEQLALLEGVQFGEATRDLPVGSALSECVFGNLTLKIGESLQTKDPCVQCTCHTPPSVSCTRQTCPSLSFVPNVTCRTIEHPGQCCRSYECVPNDTQSIDLCSEHVCPEGAVCKVKNNEAAIPYADCVAEESDTAKSFF